MPCTARAPQSLGKHASRVCGSECVLSELGSQSFHRVHFETARSCFAPGAFACCAEPERVDAAWSANGLASGVRVEGAHHGLLLLHVRARDDAVAAPRCARQILPVRQAAEHGKMSAQLAPRRAPRHRLILCVSGGTGLNCLAAATSARARSRSRAGRPMLSRSCQFDRPPSTARCRPSLRHGARRAIG